MFVFENLLCLAKLGSCCLMSFNKIAFLLAMLYSLVTCSASAASRENVQSREIWKHSCSSRFYAKKKMFLLKPILPLFLLVLAAIDSCVYGECFLFTWRFECLTLCHRSKRSLPPQNDHTSVPTCSLRCVHLIFILVCSHNWVVVICRYFPL